jgi:hypothetical protein
VPISEHDLKLLWGRAAGRCSRCREDLTPELQSGSALVLGEMAHVVARRINGPRGSDGFPVELLDSYDNHILLCPTDHTRIDKAPQEFSVEQILAWKNAHEQWVRDCLSGMRLATRRELGSMLGRLLRANKQIFAAARESAESNPLGDGRLLWELRKASTVIPNNRQIVALIEANEDLLSDLEFETFVRFREHAADLEFSTFYGTERNPNALFPSEFQEAAESMLQE